MTEKTSPTVVVNFRWSVWSPPVLDRFLRPIPVIERLIKKLGR